MRFRDKISSKTLLHHTTICIAISSSSKLLALVVLGRQDDIVLEIQLGLVVALARLEVDNEVVLDGKDGVGGQPGVVPGIQLRGAALVIGVRDLESLKSASNIIIPSRPSHLDAPSPNRLTMM